MHWATSGIEVSQWYSYSIEMLPPNDWRRQLVEHCGDLARTRSEGHVVPLAASEDVQVLHVHADDAPLEQLQRVDSPETRARPVAGVGGGADARIATLHDLEDVGGVPHLVRGVVGPLRVVVEPAADAVLLDELLDDVDRVHGLGGDRAQAHLLRELEDLAGARFVRRDTDHAVVDGTQALLGELGLDLGDGLVARVVAERHRLGRRELLAGVELDHLAARGAVLSMASMSAEAVEGVGLAADGEAAGLRLDGKGCEALCGGRDGRQEDDRDSSDHCNLISKK